MSIWTIAAGSDPATTFEAQNLGQVRARRITQAPDTVTFSQTAPFDADPVYAYGTKITIYRDSVKWFVGQITAVQRRGSASSERIQYTCSGPWWQLEQVIYRQDFLRYVDGIEDTATIAKLILGTDEAGERLNAGEVITAVLAYAAAELGAASLITAGTIETTTQMPFEELNALSCAEVIKRVLRWTPDIVAYFDYSPATPTLHLKKRSSLTAKTLAHSDVVITDNSINPRDDLQRDGVVVQYERVDTIGSSERRSIIEDTAGDTSNPLKTLYLFFDLAGGSVSFIRQEVVSVSIQETSGAWWGKRHPKLKGATGISVANSSQTAVDDGDGNDGTSYDKELVSGSIADWMTGVGTNAQIVEADVTYTPASGSARTERLRLQVTGTNANSQTYTTTGSQSPAEPTPTGLADSIWDSLKTLQYDGTLSLTEEEAGAERLIDRKLRITGGRTEWATMDAQIYSVDFDLDSGRTQISFGPAAHLGANDRFQLLRNVRTRKGGTTTARINSSAFDNNLPSRSPNTIAADDSGGSAPPLPFQVVDKGAGKIDIRAGAVDNTVLAKVTDLSTKPSSVWLEGAVSSPPNAELQSLAFAYNLSDPDDTETKFYILLSEITWDGDTPDIDPIRATSFGLVTAGGLHSLYRL